MKNLKMVAAITSCVLLGLGVAMVVTNPSQEVYEEFAVQRLTEYLQTNLCAQAPVVFGIQRQCTSSIVAIQPQMRSLVAQNTQRQDFIFFSLYKTNLSTSTLLPAWVGSLLPTYHVETVGALQNFYVYQAQEIKK